ncbi:MAG: phosphotransferase [Alphaproteobacteria bacterium]|nr:phosphotransferase [Alphaproteobacteria bacterium]
MTLSHPASPADLSAEYMTAVMGEVFPGVHVNRVSLIDAKSYGEQMVSTAGRALVELDYSPAVASSALPKRLVVKLGRGVDEIMAPFYSNEVAFYRRIRPELEREPEIEAPRCFGGGFAPETGRFSLLLEDLTARGAQFPNVTQTTSVEQVRALLDTQAALHGRFWQSPRFSTDLSWVETHLAGGVADLMNGLAPAYIQHEIDTVGFKRELVQKLRTTGPELLAGVQAVQRHQAKLPQTLLHGDSHLGNTYLLPEGRGGLLDWQLMVRGYHLHDVNYLITTALSVADRRTNERELLTYYLDRLKAAGATAVPNFEESWREYRRALVWGVYIGWLTTPVVNYGWEINVMNHLRLVTAYEDHETQALVSELL